MRILLILLTIINVNSQLNAQIFTSNKQKIIWANGKSCDINQQKYSSIVNINNLTEEKDFESSPGAHGMAVDQVNNLVYFSSVGDGAITVVDIISNKVVNKQIPKAKFGSDFGGNNMLTRQDKTGRLFQANTQPSATGLIVINERDLSVVDVIKFSNNKIPWGLWVDEENELLFAALPNANSIGVVDLKTLKHVLNVKVGDCPYAVSIDTKRKVGVSTNQGTPSINASATVFDLCKVYDSIGKEVDNCP